MFTGNFAPWAAESFLILALFVDNGGLTCFLASPAQVRSLHKDIFALLIDTPKDYLKDSYLACSFYSFQRLLRPVKIIYRLIAPFQRPLTPTPFFLGLCAAMNFCTLGFYYPFVVKWSSGNCAACHLQILAFDSTLAFPPQPPILEVRGWATCLIRARIDNRLIGLHTFWGLFVVDRTFSSHGWSLWTLFYFSSTPFCSCSFMVFSRALSWPQAFCTLPYLPLLTHSSYMQVFTYCHFWAYGGSFGTAIPTSLRTSRSLAVSRGCLIHLLSSCLPSMGVSTHAPFRLFICGSRLSRACPLSVSAPVPHLATCLVAGTPSGTVLDLRMPITSYSAAFALEQLLRCTSTLAYCCAFSICWCYVYFRHCCCWVY